MNLGASCEQRLEFIATDNVGELRVTELLRRDLHRLGSAGACGWVVRRHRRLAGTINGVAATGDGQSARGADDRSHACGPLGARDDTRRHVA